jgi:pyruvate dehydrogenase phosphatase
MDETRLMELGKRLVKLVDNGAFGQTGADKKNLALELLRNALGGDDWEKVSRNLTSEASSKWLDDITVLIERLD